MAAMKQYCEGVDPCNKISLISVNLIEEFKFKVNITIEDKINATYSVVQTPEIELIVKCSSQSP